MYTWNTTCIPEILYKLHVKQNFNGLIRISHVYKNNYTKLLETVESLPKNIWVNLSVKSAKMKEFYGKTPGKIQN